MRANLELTHGLVLSERLVFELAERIGQADARAIVSEAAARAAERGTPLRDELAADRRVPLTAGELDAAFDPGTYTGAADVFVDRALELYRGSLRYSGGDDAQVHEPAGRDAGDELVARDACADEHDERGAALERELARRLQRQRRRAVGAGLDLGRRRRAAEREALRRTRARCAPRSRACRRRGSWP